jgi:selenium metabolism protein YedF
MKTTIMINSDTMGGGSEELGAKLIGSLFRKLVAIEPKPETIIFYNGGVKLVAEGSTVLDALGALFKGGVDIVACGTCVSFFELNDKVVIGRVSNMEEIASTMLKSEKVVTI